MDTDLDLEWRKFQRRCKRVVSLPNENYSYRRWISSPNNVTAELEISLRGYR
jgi:hypothetical protein